MCEECFAAYYEHQIKEKTVADLRCPVCQVPDIADVGVAHGFFQFLDIQVFIINRILCKAGDQCLRSLFTSD